MKLREKRSSRKIVHMAIQPMIRQYRVQVRSGTQKMASPQAMLDQKQSGMKDSILEENILQIESHESLSQSSSEQENEPNSGNIEQKQQQLKQQLVKSYTKDYYQYILKPIAQELIKYSVWFVLIFCVLKIFWIYEDIQLRREDEENYLRRIMTERMTDVKMEYQHTFTFLDQVKEFLQFERNQQSGGNNEVIKGCEFYGGRYKCMNFTYMGSIGNSSTSSSLPQYNGTLQNRFIESIQSTYEFLSMEIGSLLAHIAVMNVFVINLQTFSTVQFDLKGILQRQLEGFPLEEGRESYVDQLSQESNRLQSNHINLFLNYIFEKGIANTNATTDGLQSDQLFMSYLNIPISSQQKYQLYQLYLLDSPNSTNNQPSNSTGSSQSKSTGSSQSDSTDPQQSKSTGSSQQKIANSSNTLNAKSSSKMFNLYCLNLQPSYLSDKFPSKLCVSIKQPSNPSISNILYINNKFTKIRLNQQRIISVSHQHKLYVKIYQMLQKFITTQVNAHYPQYSLHEQAIKKCLNFQQEFYQHYSLQSQNLQILRCYCTTYMHMLVSKYIFSWGRLTPDTFSYHNLLPVALVNDTEYLQIQLLYFSNLTYYSDIHKISNQGVDMIGITIKIQLIILITALFLFQFSTHILQNVMIDSIFYIKKLAKVVLILDDIKKTQNQFKKILKQIQQTYYLSYTPILGNIIGYLQKFLWIKKLYHLNKKFPEHKTKKNRLLFQGLNLFKYLNNGQFPQSRNTQSQKQQKSKKYLNNTKMKSTRFQTDENTQITDNIIKSNYRRHSGPLIYIYQEMIFLQKDKIKKFKNIQMLTKRKSQKVRSSQMNILQEIDEHRVNDSRYGFNNSSRFNFKEESHGIYEREVQKDSIFGEQVPKISIMDSKPRQNRGVRFSNQIQLKGFNNNNTEKKSKLRQQIISNSSIGNKKGSIKSVKSIQSEMKRKVEQSEKQQRSQESSGVMSSSKKMKKQTTIKNILRGDESVHEGLKTMKFDESSNIYEKESMMNKSSVMYDSVQGEISIDQFYYTQKQALQQTLESYQRMMHYYQEIVEIQECTLEKELMNNTISYEEQEQMANLIYGIELKRLKISHHYLQLLIDEHINQQQQIDFQQLGVTVNYQHLEYYEHNYQINLKLLEQAQVYKMKSDIALGKSVSYKRLEEIIDSEHPHIALEATLLYAQQLHKLKPFLDYQVINTLENSLLLYETSTSYKQQALQLIIETLHSNPALFTQEIEELKSIKKYYNRKHKKFYFIADMSESFDIFTPILTKIYQLMGKMDLMEVYNLAMNENTEDMQLVRQIIKPQSSQAFISLFQQLTLQSSKTKEKNSSKMIHKKYVCEKDFNQILDQIQKDQTQFSSFLVVILGGDQISNHSSMMTDDADSSSNQRQLNQLLHSQINRKISQNYYHFINIGTYLSNFLTKQGKLKKHIKNSPDLLEVDLIKKNLPQHFSQLQKFLE